MVSKLIKMDEDNIISNSVCPANFYNSSILPYLKNLMSFELQNDVIDCGIICIVRIAIDGC